MSIVIRFNTQLFDVSRERPNPINPIFGESLLLWLQRVLAPELAVGDPEPEDWGWFSSFESGGRRFMLGASASDEERGLREWVLQITPHRSLKERVLGQGRLLQDHPLVSRLAAALRAEAAFTDVTVEVEA